MTIKTNGLRRTVRIRVGMAMMRATVSACCLERTLGMISPKMRMITVTRMVEIVDAVQTLSRNRFITIRVEQVEIAMFARLLPMRIAESDVVK